MWLWGKNIPDRGNNQCKDRRVPVYSEKQQVDQCDWNRQNKEGAGRR